MMQNLHDIHRSAREESARRAEQKRENAHHERQTQEERERAAEEATEREQALAAPPQLMDEIAEQDNATDSLRTEVKDIGNKITHYRLREPGLLDGRLGKRVLYMCVLVIFAVSCPLLDFYLLSSGAGFLLSLAGVTWEPAIFVGKVVIAVSIIWLEWMIACLPVKRWYLQYFLPVVVATLATSTYIAHRGITSLYATTPIDWLMIVVVFLFGFALHFAVVQSAPMVRKGMTIARDIYLEYQYRRRLKAAKTAINALYRKVLEWLEAHRVLKRDFKIEVMPPFYLLPALTRQLFNEKVGYSFFPDPSVGGSGDGAASPPSWTNPDTPEEDGWNSSNSS